MANEKDDPVPNPKGASSADDGGQSKTFEDPKSHAPTVKHEIQADEPSRPDTDATALADTVNAADIVEGYQLAAKLGEGGMGVVYKAIQRSLNREVALKLMKDMGDDESFVARFRREAITGARLNHPNIVGVYDHGHIEGNVFLVLEYVNGRNCAEILEASGRMDVQLATQIIRGCVLGLSHAEQLGVIHRDIKPANIMIVEDDNSDARGTRGVHPKIADFGLARLHDNNDPDHIELTQTGSVMGTPGYMAPEQALGKEVDFRADIYSLGSTYYCLLTGSKPFHGSTMIEVLHKKLNEMAPNPQDLVGDIPDSVVVVLDRMMAKSQDDRYQSYENLLSDLDSILSGEIPQTLALEAAASSLNVGGVDTRKSLMIKRGVKAKGTGSNSRKILIGVAVLLLVAVVWALSQPDDGGSGGGKSNPSVAALEGKLRDWGGESASNALAAFDTFAESFDSELKNIDDDATRKKLADQLATALGGKLTSNEAFVLEPLESSWKRRDWLELGKQVESVKKLYARAGSKARIPERLARLSRFAALAQDGNAGAKEKAEFAALESASADEETLTRLKKFMRDFEFSPARDWASSEVARIEKIVAATQKSAGFNELLAGIEKRSGQDFLRYWADNGDDWKKEINSLPQAEMSAAQTKLGALTRRKKTDAVQTLAEQMKKLWKAHSYDELRGLVLASDSLLSKIGESKPSEWDQYRRIAEESKGAVGLGEKSAWETIVAEKDDVNKIFLLQSYVEKFGSFSPMTAEAKDALEKAAAKAPLFELVVNPSDAVVRINNIKVAKNEMRLHRLLGDYEIEAEAPGYYELSRSHKHGSGGTKLILNLAKKTSKSIGLAADQSANIPLHINPLNTRKPAFPMPRGLQVGVEPKEAGLIVSAHNKKDAVWRETSRDIFVGRMAKILFPDENARFWQLHGRIVHKTGETEIRILKSSSGASVAVGLRPLENGSREVYFGTRQADGSLNAAFTQEVKDEGDAIRFSLSWYGDVCVLALCDELVDNPKKARVVASVELSYEPKQKAEITLAVNRGEALFANLELYPMK